MRKRGTVAGELPGNSHRVVPVCDWRLTTACTRPRVSMDVVENLPLITLNARRVMPGVRRHLLREDITRK
jgi:hypothetical protein